MSACDLISTSTTDEWPLAAAACNGVPLLYIITMKYFIILHYYYKYTVSYVVLLCM